MTDLFCFLSPSPLSPSVSPGHDVTRDTLIKFSRGTRPHRSPHGQDRLLCHSFIRRTNTHTHTHTHTESLLLWCGSEPSSLFCGPSNYRAFLCEVYFRGCSARSMFFSYNGLVYMWPKSNTHADMDVGLLKHGDSGSDRRLVLGLNEKSLYSHKLLLF